MSKLLRNTIIIAVIAASTVLAFAQVKKKTTEVITEKAEEVTNLMQKPVTKEEIQEIINENIEDEVTLERLKDNWTIACFGIDSRTPDELDSGNSDVILLIAFDKNTGAIRMSSVYRDTCLKVGNKLNKANSAYASGGAKKAVKMLNDNLDLQVDDYVAFNWKTVATAINLLGGVDIEITKPEYKYINGFITETVNSTGIGSVQFTEPGLHHMDGVQAVAYARLRLMDNDFKRTERQRLVLSLMLEKAQNVDIQTLKQFVQVIFPMTASSIDGEDIEAVLHNLTKIRIETEAGFPEDIRMDNGDGRDYVFPYTLESNVSKLHETLYGVHDYEPSRNVKEISYEINDYRQSIGRKREKAQETVAENTEPAEDMNEQAESPENTESMESQEANDENMEMPAQAYGPGEMNMQPETISVTPMEYGPGMYLQMGPGEPASSEVVSDATGEELSEDTSEPTGDGIADIDVQPAGPGVQMTGEGQENPITESIEEVVE